MSFKDIDLKLKLFYDSDEDDILQDFYIPVLSESVSYRRQTGDFSSTALAAAARGVQELVKNNGKMEIVAEARLKHEDMEAIEKGYKNPEEVLKEFEIEDLDSIENKFVKDHVRALGWLIANKMLEIKIAVVPEGIFHPKVGIFEDKEGNLIAFQGSVNETYYGWRYNVEVFNVFRSWEPGQEPYLQQTIRIFDKYWEGRAKRVKVFPASEAIRQKLIEIAPKNFEELDLEKWYKHRTLLEPPYERFEFNPKNIQPWVHQKRVLERIKENNYGGILKMATGTGKTETAFLALEQFFKDTKRYGNRIVILVHRDEIGSQWRDFMYKNTGSDDLVFYYSHIGTREKRDLARVWKRELDSQNIFLIILVQSLHNFNFYNKPIDFLIADEVHSYGTENYMNRIKKYLGENIDRSLGLSATPERYYDDEGTKRISDYFGPIIFEYGIKQAQNEPKAPGEENVLAKYFYHLSLTTLTPDEEDEVKKMTKKIGRTIAIDFENEISEKENVIPTSAEWLMERRAYKLKTSKSKLEELKKILLKNVDSLDQCMVFCEDRDQLNDVKEVFKSLGISSYVVYHSYIYRRGDALRYFKDRNCKFILALKLLDQGVNIPECHSAIFMSSSGNPREYIQRRGRVLRNYKGKPSVKIFDIMALPKETDGIYRGLVKTRLLRAWEFIRCSLSPEEKLKLEPILKTYKVSKRELDKIIGGW